ncbi:MAG: hypothetical protein ABH849_03480 [Nanoarchaeota archaeon]|nr:hypothetical protein [Nanoarchaeota archaeon]
MKKETTLKIIGVAVATILILNLVFFAFLITNWIAFWAILVVCFIFVWKGLPLLKEKYFS